MFVTTTAAPPADTEFSPFRPALQERFLARFHRAVQDLVDQPLKERERIFRAEVEWARVEQGNPRQQALYQAVWLLLRDLLRVGWALRWNVVTGTLEVAPPPVEDRPRTPEGIQAHKRLRRAIMGPERHTRLVQARDFIARMETPLRGLPITALIADGPQLAADLRAVREIQEDAVRLAALRQVVQPYLQLVEEGIRCPHTDQPLQDIWRYFRLTWASPVYNTPGRGLFYLVRDAARPNHPVMGIASLENSPIYIGVRDYALGWSVEGFERDLLTSLQTDASQRPTSAILREAFGRLLGHIDRAIGDIRLNGLCTPEEAACPTPQLIRRLMDNATDFARARQQALREWTAYQNPRTAGEIERELQRSPYGNISIRAQELLFMKKRAGELARLLGSRLAITQFLERTDIVDNWQHWCRSERGRSAVRTGLLAIKNQHVGTSILELNICGAIPPYNYLLAGKLTALLMCSPQIAADYRRRYGRAPSEIASQLKGEEVIRPAELVYIGTTGLYTAGASQYNRLRLPARLLQDDAPEIRFEYLGDTLGYGTAHISDATTAALEAASSDDFVQVNHILGEGISPKLRIVRWGLDTLFRDGQRPLADRMSMHQMQRHVYGVWLAKNGKEYLHGQVTTPRYIWDEALDLEEGSARIADFWRRRWLDARLRYEPALDQVSQFRAEDLLLSPELTHQSDIDWAYTLIKNALKVQSELSLSSDQPPAPTDDERQRRLIRDLYRGTSGFADDIPIDDLRRLHASSDLDEAIRRHIRARRSVVLTGNPGDGKTHLLRILADEIGALGAVVEQDASAVPNDQIVANWRVACDQGRPYFLAINESVLFNLVSAYPDFAPLQQARQQVIDAISYDGPPNPPLDDVVVFDLSHRNTLSERIVNGVLDKLTAPSMLPRCTQCPARGCDLMRNRTLLTEPEQRLRRRLQAIFERITHRGIHVTMRDLQAFVSYLLFADRDCAALLRQSDEAALALPQLPYRGVGPLFDAVRTVFDPVTFSHPVYDDQLVNNLLAREDWLTFDEPDGGSLEPVAVERFEQRKRAFYFYHQLGEVLLMQGGDDEQAFAAFLAEQNARRAVRSIVQKLRMFFGRVADGEQLPVWQSHRYDQSAQRMIYAVQQRDYRDFELLRPQLAQQMAEAFELPDDHRLLRLRTNPRAQLRIDFALFRLLHQAEQGLPALLLQPDLTRRIWQFLEQLTDRARPQDRDVTVQILDKRAV